MKWLFSTFLTGLLFIVPGTVTVFVTLWAFHRIDGLLNLPFTGLGFLICIGITLLVGVLATNILFSKTVDALERGLTRLPLVKLIYFSIKDLIGAFVGEKKRFRIPVLVDMFGSEPAVKMIGFLTQDIVPMMDIPDHVAVYLPQAYTFSGVTVVVPRKRIQFLKESDAARWMAFIVSGGVSLGVNSQGEESATTSIPIPQSIHNPDPSSNANSNSNSPQN